MSTITTTRPQAPALSLARVNGMRAGFLLMAAGLAVVKWPLLADASSMPLHQGVSLCMLTALSVLALLGLRYPVQMLPVLLFESGWKILWLSLVALPRAVTGRLDPSTAETLVNCSLVLVILALIPWQYTWRRDVREIGEPWR